MKRILLFALIFVSAGLVAYWFYLSAQSPQIGAQVTALQAATSIEGFARADRIRVFQFPADHGPHPEYQTEWWYYTGNLDTADGRHFGYQLTFFRRAITPTLTARASDWATNQIYFAHFALTDVDNNAHSAVERFERGAAGLAGADGNPYHVWLDDWRVDSLDADGNQVRLRANDSGRALDLVLRADKPLVLHRDQGLSQKTSEVGDASYYYSFTRLASEGTLTTGDTTFNVTGLSWMDHEFGTTTLGPNAVGWDWFSIQLSDNRELMYYQIREKDGGIEPLSGGTLIAADGTATHLNKDQVNLRVTGTWQSRETNANYPSSWQLEIPSAGISLTLRPYVNDQENRVSIIYWEGAVRINGTSNGATVTGSGYVELTGYVPVK